MHPHTPTLCFLPTPEASFVSVQGGGTAEGTAGNPCMDFLCVCVCFYLIVTLSHVVEQ